MICDKTLKKLVSFYIGISLLLLNNPALAQNWGRIQLTVVSPDPVKAGEEVVFQVIVLNTGEEKWAAGSYVIEIELFDSEKGYLTTTRGYKGMVDVDSGETTLVYIPFKIPEDYSGAYYYKITLTHEAVRTITSEHYDFIVIPVVVPAKPLFPVKIGGNTILSFRDNSEDNWKNYLGNISVNMVGRVYNNPVQFSAYTYHTRDEILDFDRVLFSYYGKDTNISAGDVMPSFSSLVLYSKGMRGFEISNKKNKLKTSLVGAVLAEKEAGSEEKSGVFSQYLLGGHGEVKLPYNLCVDLSAVSSFDNVGSLNDEEMGFAEIQPSPVRNNVGGVSVKWEPVSSEEFEVDVNGEYAVSDYRSDISDDSGAQGKAGKAWKLGFDMNRGSFLFSGKLQRINPDFVSLGSPTATRDRAGFDMTTSCGFSKNVSVSGGYNSYSDNLENDITKVTVNQSILSGGLSLNLEKLPPVNIGYSLNRMLGNPENALNNYSSNWSVGMACNWGRTSLSLGGQISDFKDNREESSIHDLNTIMGNMNLNMVVNDILTVTSGVNLSRKKDLHDKTAEATRALSIGMNYKVVPEKLVLIGWGSLSQAGSGIENTVINTNMELNYNVKRTMTLTLGHNWKKPEGGPENSDVHGFIFRLSNSF